MEFHKNTKKRPFPEGSPKKKKKKAKCQEMVNEGISTEFSSTQGSKVALSRSQEQAMDSKTMPKKLTKNFVVSRSPESLSGDGMVSASSTKVDQITPKLIAKQPESQKGHKTSHTNLPSQSPVIINKKSKKNVAISKATISDDSSDSSSECESDSGSEPVSFVPSPRIAKGTTPKNATNLSILKSRNATGLAGNNHGTEAPHKAKNKRFSASGSNHLGGAEFRKQPPMCIRKMTIIEMELSLFDSKGQPIEIEKASFQRFIDDDKEPEEEKTRNGIHYKIETVYSDGTRQCEDLYLRVVDGRDGELVHYEGKDMSEDLKRVLITHEASCARCRTNQSCGTQPKAPGNPVILDRRVLKFYVRCNTTCAVKHGGRVGKQNNRTFKFVFSSTPDVTEESTLASSTQVNVHNNTKMKKLLHEGFNPFTREWGEPLPVE